MLRQVGARAVDGMTGGRAEDRRHLLAVLAAGAVPLVVLGILLSAPDLDGHWENNSAHFWIVLIAGLASTSLGYAVREAALRRHDARLFLVSLGFIASAGFLALHALATPGVVVGGKNAGFVIAPPVGLLIAGVFVAASALDLSPAAGAAVMRHSRLLTGAVLALIAAWGVVSVAELPPLSHSLQVDDARVPLAIVAGIGVLVYAYAAAGYYRLYRQRHARLVFAVSFAFAILAEASIVFGPRLHPEFECLVPKPLLGRGEYEPLPAVVAKHLRVNEREVRVVSHHVCMAGRPSSARPARKQLSQAHCNSPARAGLNRPAGFAAGVVSPVASQSPSARSKFVSETGGAPGNTGRAACQSVQTSPRGHSPEEQMEDIYHFNELLNVSLLFLTTARP